MKRDMELVRELLLAIEDGAEYFGTEDYDDEGNELTKEVAEKNKAVGHHIQILLGAGMISVNTRLGSGVLVSGLTWKGHDFLDSIRDPDVWRRTKEGASKAGGAGFAFIVEIGKAYAKSKLQELGVPLL